MGIGRLTRSAFALLLLTTPVVAQTQFSAVAASELDRFVGQNLFGEGHVNLGVVAGVDRETGLMTVVGQHGEVAWVDSAGLLRDGPNLWAPGVTRGTIKMASDANLAYSHFATPQIRVIEPPAG